ncbi:hypothetical protein [Nocardia grenadensis]|uniref:hypothetical protein n=1 Tax=Nocardia grenadensis TaxID=931537 RepID=UPI003D947379
MSVEPDPATNFPATSAPTGGSDASHSDTEPCPRCRTATCLAHVRITDKPDTWIDVVDRFFTRFSSEHWGWKKTLQLLALISGLLWMAVIAHNFLSWPFR